MGKYDKFEKIGLREKGSKELVAVYPKKPEGSDAAIEEDVKYWYYQQSCSAENRLKDLYVDALTEQELRSYKG